MGKKSRRPNRANRRDDTAMDAYQRAVVEAAAAQGLVTMPDQGAVPTTEDVDKFIPTPDLLAWEREMQRRFPQVYTPEDPLLGTDARQHAIGTNLLVDVDGDPAKRTRCEVMGSKWTVWNVDGDREPVYVVLVNGGELTQLALSNCHEEHNARVVRGEGGGSRYNGTRPFASWGRQTRVDAGSYPDPTEFGWTFTGSCAAGRVEFFEKEFPPDRGGRVKLDFYYTTGTVKTALDHPRQGKTQLFAKGDNLSPATYLAILHNPRRHTGVRYQRSRQR